ncbi:hypothetical protein LOC71_16945 [Rhodopirellula sp. JC740]|uniref:Uncharacterized protein n=1 Tax=Rhodopirellula halodulae TaxID=2894198 RepID=A0ABS8NM23_9BACT|nr:hypothetical protein [Rhodopirellula sp. JC740]MCC9643972.1 hypothetical protein [Rhodopirellula sp. JC740]
MFVRRPQFCFRLLLLSLVVVVPGSAVAQQSSGKQKQVETVNGPVKDVSFQALWLIESDDVHRVEYDGPAREALSKVGFGRLVPAGSVVSALTVGRDARLETHSRYGKFKCQVQFLNTTEPGQLQALLELEAQPNEGVAVYTTVRVPMDKWFLAGAGDSRVGLPVHADDGKRAVLIMKVTEEVIVLE